MPRYVEITLRKRSVTCVAALLDEHAPHTCRAVWEALPQEGDVYHAKYASNEIYALVPACILGRTERMPRLGSLADVCPAHAAEPLTAP